MKDKDIFAIIIGCLIIVSLFFIFTASKECSDNGGRLVRGIFWFECVKSLDKPNEKR